MSLKGFSASYVAVDPFEGSEEETGSDSSEMVTPFPGSLKSIYANKLGTSDTDDEDETFYNEFDNHNLIKQNNKKKKSEVSENGLIP